MSNEIKITGLVPKKELNDLAALLDLFEKTKTSYAELADKLAGGLNIKPNSLQELKLKAEDATKVMREMALVQNQLAQIQEDYKKLVLQLNEATKARTATIVEEAKANDLNAAATLKTEKAEAQRLKNQKAINQETKQRKVSIEEMVKLLDFESDSYYETNKAMLTLERGYKSLSKTQRESEFGTKTVSKIQLLKDELKTLDSGMGNYQRNVGNYASHWNGLSNAVNQVVREVPSAAISLNTFFLAISNNLPILVDEIKKVKIENDALRQSNEKTVPLWKTIASSIFSWQSAMIAAITVLSMYGKQIFAWIGSLINVKGKIDETAEAQKRLNDAKRQGVIDSIKETSSLRLLYKAATDASRSTEERAFAIKELKSLFPEYFSFLNDETIKSGKAADVYYLLTERIKASAKARRTESLLIDNIEKQNKLIGETALKTIEAKKAQEEYNIAVEVENSSLIFSSELSEETASKRKKLFKVNNELSESQKKLREQTLINLKVEKSIDVTSLFGDPQKLDDASKKNEAFWSNQKAIAETALKQIESSVKSSLDKASSENKNIYNLGIDKGIVDSYKSNIEKINEANENLRVYDFSVKTNKQLETEQERHSDYMRRIDNELSKARATILEQEKDNEIATIQAKYQEKASKLKGDSEKEKELRKTYTEAMEKEINDVKYKYSTQIEQENLKRKIEAIRENTDSELEERLSLELQMNEILGFAEAKSAKDRGEDVDAVEKLYKKKSNDIIESNINSRIGIINKGNDIELDILDTDAQKQINILERKRKSGEITEEKYQDELYRITKEAGSARLQLLLKEAEAELELSKGKLSEDKIKEIQARIESLKAEIDAFNLGDKDDDNPIKRKAESFSQSLQDMQSNAQKYLGGTASIFGAFTDIINKLVEHSKDGVLSFDLFWKSLSGKERLDLVLTSFAQIQDGITSLMVDIYDKRIEKLDEQQEANDEDKDRELEKIQKLEESGAISKEEAEARKRAAEDRTSQKNKEIEKQKAALQRKQANWEKANAVAQTIIFTALAITKALPNFILAALVGVLGAAQLATIIAQPIPKYREGTKDHPGGLAVVGDGGQREAIITPSGDSFITPNIATMVDIPKHSMVIPNLVDYVKQIKLKSDLGLTMRDAEMRGEPININVSNDFRSLEKKLDRMSDSFDNLAKYQRKAAVEAELNYLKSRL